MLEKVCEHDIFLQSAVDQIGFELQNPFFDKNLSHLPLDKICNTIRQDVREIFNQYSAAKSSQKKG